MTKPTLDDKLLPITTLLSASWRAGGRLMQSQASGFFYCVQTPLDPDVKGKQWHKLEGMWLVTNRHVVLCKPTEEGPEQLVEDFSFRLRVAKPDGGIDWLPLELDREELQSLEPRARDH